MKNTDKQWETRATLEDLRKIPYLNVDAIGPRVVNIMPLWDGERWRHWLPTVGAGLFEMHPVGAYKSDYVAKTAADESDIIIPFAELMWQRASWPHTADSVLAILNGFHDLGTSIEKIDRFFLSRDDIGFAATDMVVTELEYLFVKSKSIFDLLQKVIAGLWETIKLNDPIAQAKHKQCPLPATFRPLLYKDNKPRTREDLIDSYAILPALADAYAATRSFFAEIKSVRDAIVHGSQDRSPLIYAHPRGFFLPKNFREILHISCPLPDAFDGQNENLVSLSPLLAYLVVNTIDCCSHLVTQFARQIELLPEVAPGYRIFIRGPYNDSLIWVLGISKGGSPWWSDRQRKPKVEPPLPPVPKAAPPAP